MVQRISWHFHLRCQKRLCKDRVFSVRDIDGVVLGSGNGCNVVYGAVSLSEWE